MRWLALLALIWGGMAAAEPRADWISSYTWTDRSEAFGGLSGIDLGPDGREAVIISDAGLVARVDLIRTDGALSGARIAAVHPLRDAAGLVRTGTRNDAEGLQWEPDGSILVSFEGPARVHRYAFPGAARARMLPQARQFARFAGNRGFEALARGPDGCLLVLPESAEDGIIEVWSLCDGRWQLRFVLPQVGRFVPVGADMGPDGWLYLLERHFTGVGFRTQIRRVDFWSDAPKVQRLLTSITSAFDNLEGIAAWRGADGRVRLTTVSDDNFFALQKTQIVEFVVRE